MRVERVEVGEGSWAELRLRFRFHLVISSCRRHSVPVGHFQVAAAFESLQIRCKQKPEQPQATRSNAQGSLAAPHVAQGP